MYITLSLCSNYSFLQSSLSAGSHNFGLEKDGGGGGAGGVGLGTRVPLPPGRITGSASIETLVRVGIEKENGLSPDSKMVIVHDFTPCVDDELQVKRGQVSSIPLRFHNLVNFSDSLEDYREARVREKPSRSLVFND